MTIRIYGDYNGDVEPFIADKFGFLEEWTNSPAEVYIQKEKAGALTRVKVVVDHLTLESNNHRSLAKCVAELTPKLKRQLRKEKEKIKQRKGQPSIRKIKRPAEPLREDIYGPIPFYEDGWELEME